MWRSHLGGDAEPGRRTYLRAFAGVIRWLDALSLEWKREALKGVHVGQAGAAH